MIVVDVQLAVYWTTPSPHKPIAQRVHRRDKHWCAPRFWRSEYRNAIVGLLRTGRITIPRADQAYTEALRAFAGREYDVSPFQLLRTSTRCNLTAYDLEFVLLAQQLGVPLVTFDKQILAEFPLVAVEPAAFLA